MIDTEFVIVPERQDVVVKRRFNAPRDLVFDVYTDPAKIPNWSGPRWLTTTVDRMDVEIGGVWRFVQRDADGNEYAFRGVYHDVVKAERLVHTFQFEGTPGVVLVAVSFEDVEGDTLLTEQHVFQSREHRDAMVRSGMEPGTRERIDRLGELIGSIGT